MSKSEMVAAIAEDLEMTRQDVTAVLDALTGLTILQLRDADDNERVTVLPGALKVYKKYVEAKPKRKGLNPFTGEMQWFKAKPASYKVKATVLAKIKSRI